MFWPPLIERELRVALHKKRPVRGRLVTASICVGATLLFLWIAWMGLSSVAGRRLHQFFCLVGGYIVLRAPSLAAGAFAEERGAQTLGLLFLSGLSGFEVFASKALSAALVTWNDLLALLPMLALPFFIGGVSFDLFVATILTLPLLMVFVLAVTLLASVLTEEEGVAVVLAVLVGVVICALPPALYAAQSHFAPTPPSAWWLRLSPAYAPWLVWRGQVPRAELASNWAISLAWSALLLTTAAVMLKRLWREQEEGARNTPWREHWRALVHGQPGRRALLAARWFDVNPFVWLAARDGQATFLAWTMVGGITSVWLLCWALWRARWPSIPNLLITVALLNGSLYWLVFHTAARSLAQPRRDGAFELLLTTSLQPTEVVWGALEALKRQFRAVGLSLVVLDAAFLLGGLATRRWNAGALFVYAVAAGLLLWWAWTLARGWRYTLMVVWAGLNSGRPALATWRLSGVGWANLFNFYLFRDAFSKFPSFPSGSLVELIFACAILVFVAIAVPIHRFRLRRGSTATDQIECRLISELREIAREPLPDRDHPGFKQWNPRERFPWGWELIQEQLHERVVRRRSTV